MFESSLVLILLCLFCLAFFHSSLGLGGGSTYNSLFLLCGISYTVVPSMALVLNIIVSFLAFCQYSHARHFSFQRIFPFLISSIPLAYLGGSLAVSEKVFVFILIITLCLVLFRLIYKREKPLKVRQSYKLALSLSIGGVLGFLAGTIGIGGGIFLIPLMIIFNIASAKQAAACGAFFIFINSIIGLIARTPNFKSFPQEFIYFVIVIVFAGFLGSYKGAKKWSVSYLTKVLIGIVSLMIILLIRRLL